MNFKALGENLGLEEEEFRELMELFVQTGWTDVQHLESALAEGNADQAMRTAHTIKGASGNLGLAEFSAMAHAIEQHALNHRMDDASSVFQQLKRQFEAIQSEL